MPDWKDEIRKRLADLRLSPVRETEIVEELSLHLEDRYRELLSGGASEDEACRLAIAELKECELLADELRRVERQVEPEPVVLGTNRRRNMIGDLWQDIRYGWRMLGKNPGFTSIAVLTLALGIGATTVMFSLIHSVLLRPLPFREPDRLVLLWETVEDRKLSVSYLNYSDWKEATRSFEGLGAIGAQSFTVTTPDGAERVVGAFISANLFDLTGVSPVHGRTFLPQEDQPDATPVVMIGQSLWRDKFGARSDVLGKQLQLNGKSATIVGVMPEHIPLPYPNTRIWIPLMQALSKGDRERRGAHGGMSVIGRLKPDVDFEQARIDISSIAKRLEQEFPDSNQGVGVGMSLLHEEYIGDYRGALLTLFGAALFVLLIASANVANLILSRNRARAKEIAIRTALGASRSRLLRQLLVEYLMLSFIAGLIGLWLCFVSLPSLRLLFPNAEMIPGISDLTVQPVVLAFNFGIAILSALFFGVIPALRAGRISFQSEINRSLAGRASRWRGKLSNILVVSEIAMAIVLLTGTGLMLRTLYALLTTDPGFDSENVLTVKLDLEGSSESQSPERIREFYLRAIEEVRALPGVIDAGAVRPLPHGGGGGRQRDIQLNDSPIARPEENIRSDFTLATPGYFQTMRIPLLRGRHFTPDDTVDNPLVAIVDESFARTYYPDMEVIGKRIRFPVFDREAEIVGVAGHVKSYGVHRNSRIQIYLPHAQSRDPEMVLVLRTREAPELQTPFIRQRIGELNPNVPVQDIQTMDQASLGLVNEERFVTILLTVFSAIALSLAVVGVYGLMQFSVVQRTREIGIRMALGAQRFDILKMILRHGGLLIAMGLLTGLAGAFAFTRLIAGLLFGISGLDPLTFFSMPLILALVALLACYIPARRATKVDPMVALRYE